MRRIIDSFAEFKSSIHMYQWAKPPYTKWTLAKTVHVTGEVVDFHVPFTFLTAGRLSGGPKGATRNNTVSN
jgi:hypothetical protein